MDRLEINKEVFRNQVNEIDGISKSAIELQNVEVNGTISAAYSEVSGLDQMGSFHGAVVDGGVGSAVTTLQKYAQQVGWLRDGLLATEQVLLGQEDIVDRAVQIADLGGVVSGEAELFPQRPDVVFEDFDFPVPVVSIPSSLAELSSAFSSTDSSAVGTTAEVWRAMGKNASQLAESIRTTAWDMDEINKARAIERAVDHALDIADGADRFAVNAQVMASSVEAMGAVEQAGAFHVALAELALAFIEDPLERAEAERAFLDDFMGSTFPAAVESVVPTLRNLMDFNAAGNRGGTINLAMSDINGNGGLPGVQLIQAGSQQLQGLINDPRGMSASSFGQISQQAAELAGVGGVGTQAASVTAPPTLGGMSSSVPTMTQPANGLSAGLPQGFGSGNSSGLMPGLIGGAAGSRGAANVGTRGAGIGTVSSGMGTTGAHSGLPAIAGSNPGGTFANANPLMSGMLPAQTMGTDGRGATDVRGFGAGSASRRREEQRGGGSSMAGAGAGLGQGAAAGALGAGVGALGAGALSAGAAPMGASAAGAGSAAATGRSVAPFGGMPMAGAPQENKRSKVKSVTSPLEDEGNMKALLGDLPPVVPGAIGAWARS
ncbi:hypothetical protein [Corynebacterium epidermidicanis]|uniref:PPE family protein n=1 Tax=Corynebacterium epidermidicanis TaxID=1050174 RepID=A0A0G3GT62_9CORY|nr:hypothetical protein [Corynebacterium epidermidicanis]AKK02713.1 hypothetical protein CEPID_04200 [Corynebacterium epidermidicanis]